MIKNLFQVGSSTWLNYFTTLEESSTHENLSDRRLDKMEHFAPSERNMLALAKTSISVSMVDAILESHKIEF